MRPIPDPCKERTWLALMNGSGCPAATKQPVTIMSYNILCQKLVRRSLFPYAGKASLKWKRRKDMLLNELMYWSSDIMCLQEVGIEHWYESFAPCFKVNGYDSRMFCSAFKSHGVTISWKKSKFHVVDELGISMDNTMQVCGEVLKTKNVALIVVLRAGPTPGTPPSTNTAAGDADASLNISSNGGGSVPGIIISNTHLFWVPGACYERLQQQIAMLRGLKSIQQKYPGFPVISCGDFNTTPDDAGYDLLTKSRPVNLNEWQLDNLLPRTISDNDNSDGTQDNSDKEPALDASSVLDDNAQPPLSYATIAMTSAEENKEAANTKRRKLEEEEHKLEEQLKIDSERVQRLVKAIQDDYQPMQSCYGTYSELDPSYRTEQWHGEPIFTNYAIWKGTLDYIFFTPETTSLVLREVLSLPAEKRMKPGLPNDTFPSDHVSLIARFDM
ncbi:RNA exonuclease ngl2 [Coemansia spiralis]|uniref:RNA exonuclease ngl2 n=2 Tax=Coemansia TaxID=4863 RepID=A0A9W8GCS5_9FUNG|nr:Endonuclease/exonuclease/phosphatase [Coemansia spiralis]KAJ1996320.1 RNA exonuclease ngl2 [Coemansia umbellata]KAJ2625921.1 RNA exonuclease ngl2 [Coemansia sp. RSA 1358]KAJ2680749.1 RNA exonuclease ngl2 [Coemansia spiralis]